MASLRCHGDSDCNKTQIIRNFHLYIIQLWKPFFHIFTHGDVINAQPWEVSPPKKSSRATLNNVFLILQHSLVFNIFHTLKRNFASLRGHVIYIAQWTSSVLHLLGIVSLMAWVCNGEKFDQSSRLGKTSYPD